MVWYFWPNVFAHRGRATRWAFKCQHPLWRGLRCSSQL